MIVNNSSSSSNIKLTRTDLWRTIAKDYSRDRTSLQSVLTSDNRSQQVMATRPLNKTPTMRSRCQHTDQKGQVSMTAIDQWRDRSEYTKIIQSLKRGDKKKKEALNEVTKVTNEMKEFIYRIGRRSITPEEDK